MLTEGKSVKTSAIFICGCSNTGPLTPGSTTRSQEEDAFFFPFEDLIWNADFIISAIIYADRSPSSRICSSPSLFAAFLQVQPQWFMKWIHEKHRKNQLFRVTCKLNKCLLLANFSTAEAKRTSKIYQHEQFQRGETLFPNKWDACLHPTVCLISGHPCLDTFQTFQNVWETSSRSWNVSTNQVKNGIYF